VSLASYVIAHLFCNSFRRRDVVTRLLELINKVADVYLGDYSRNNEIRSF